ncbi:MAG: penicillin-binding protein 1C [Spirochaetes bacterium]|nr:penicillin-binding protein 1C [Spirochaetota bacterium]
MVISLVFFPLPARLNSDYSQTYYYRDGSLAWISLNHNDQYRTYVPLKKVSPYIKKGIVHYEDRFFYYHPGFNPLSIIRAFFQNVQSGQIVSGGSTITMQLARLSEPKSRNIWSKIIELLRAGQIESCFSKNKILEMYINLIPMGGNIEGIGAASYFYFGKTVKQLTFADSALLISISNSPEQNRPDLNPINARINREKVGKVIASLFQISQQDLVEILNKKIPDFKNSFSPDIIPLIERFQDFPAQPNRTLTIDPALQQFCLDIMVNQLLKLETYNGAVMVIDNQTQEILTYIGSPFYHLDQGGTKFNAANILRSPGSTLKPFIYARALETGIATQKMVLLDYPKDFYGYRPKNFSNKYHGLIPFDQSLILSLNIPAVYLTELLKEDGLKNVFIKCGMRNQAANLVNDDLSIALGSYPVTLENLVQLYSALANEGHYRDLVFTKKNTLHKDHSTKILSKESIYIISQILSELYRPDLPSSWEFSPDKPRVAFKTGTSYGFVDAWSIGYTPRYTIGVWVGNLNNRFTRILTGIHAAAPVLFNIINELERKNDQWFTKPEKVQTRQVCAVSGMPPNPFCSKTVTEYYISDISASELCHVHRRIVIDKASNKAISLNDIHKDGDYEDKIIEIWDQEIENFLTKTGKKSNYYLMGNYADIVSEDRITILSPQKNVSYIIDPDQTLYQQKIALKAAGFPDSKVFYWYVNHQYIGTSKANESIFYFPDEERAEISVIDSRNRKATIQIAIEFLKK